MATGSGRPVFVVNAVVSLALVILVAAVALVVNPPTPPGIAAFAPQASKPITKAPPGQSSSSGTGAGSCGTGQTCTPPTETPSQTPTTGPVSKASAAPSAAPTVVAGVPSALQCFAWPDGSVTQTFDPQSPPCVPDWPGQAKGNGGATSSGVTGTAITVAVPRNTSGSELARMQPIVDFFNSHFELFGRKIRLVTFDSVRADTTSYGDPSEQHSYAEAAAQLRPFAALDFFDDTPNEPTLPAYMDQLANDHVISIAGGSNTPYTTDAQMAKHAPYEWSYFPTSEELLASVGSEACSQLAGHTASHSGDYRNAQRTFAVLVPDDSDTGGLTGLNGLGNALKGCTGKTPEIVHYAPGSGNGTNLALALEQFQKDAITTVIKLPWVDDASPTAGAQSQADQIGYHPEWDMMGWQAWAAGFSYASTPSAGQLKHSYGVGVWNKLFPDAQEPWHVAYTTAGGDPSATFHGAASFYHELLLLASGLQAAGPHLTPQAFAAALHATTFPNPGAAAAPTYQATVGFSGSIDTMVRDEVPFSYDPTMTQKGYLQGDASFNDFSAFCYVALGRRGSIGHWNGPEQFGQGTCR